MHHLFTGYYPKIFKPFAFKLDFKQSGTFHTKHNSGKYNFNPYHKEDNGNLTKFDYIVSNPPFKLDFSDFRDDLDSKENNERFFAGIPKVPKKAKIKWLFILLFIQHIMYSLKKKEKLRLLFQQVL